MSLVSHSATRFGWRDGLLPVAGMIGLVAALPFLLPGFPATRDSLSHLFRVWALHTAILGGELYPRWFDAFVYGYGYPLLNFYGPLLYYLAELPRLAGLDTIAALRLAVAASEVLAAAGAYLLARDLFGRGGGLLAAACYVAAPYFQTDLLVRGAFPEALGIALMPFALWTLGRSGTRWIIVGGLVAALLVLAHNAAALIGLPVMAGYGAWLALTYGQPRRLAATVLSLLLALALAAFFWLPAVVELNAVWLGGPEGATTFLQSLAKPAALVQRTLIHDYTEVPGAFLPAGLVQMLLALAGLPFAVRRREGWFFGLLLVASLALMMTSAAPVWQRLPLATLMAFPWRLQALTALATAILAGGAGGMLALLPRWRVLGWLGVGVLTLAALAAGLGGLRPGLLDIVPADIGPGGFARFDRWSGFIGTTSPVQFRPRAVQEDPAMLPLPAPMESAPGTPPVVTSMSETGGRLSLAVTAGTAATLRLRAFAFPGWTAEIDGKPLAVEPDGPAGIVALPVPAGEHQVTLWFGDTPVRQAGLVLSGLGVVALAAIAMVRLHALTFRHRQPALQRAGVAALVPVALLGWHILQSAPQPAFVPKAVDVGPMRLLGYRVDPAAVTADGWLDVQTAWQVIQPLGEGWQSVAAVQDSSGRRVATSATLPRYGTVSPARWASGDVLHDAQGVNLPPGLGPDTYQLLLGWRAPDGTEALTIAGEIGLPGTVKGLLPAGVISADVAFENGIRLIGARAKPAMVLPLGLVLPLPKHNVPPALEVTLVWQTSRIQNENFSTFIHFNRGNGTLAQALSFPPLDQRYTTGWPVDRPVVQRFRLNLPDVPPGGYEVVAGLFRRPSQERLKTADGGDTAMIERFRRQAPLPGTRLDASFGEVSLIGYDRVDSCGATVRPPCTLTMRLVWRGDESAIEPLTAFVHLVGPDGTIAAQSDGPIAGGADPTETWQQGDLVEETRRVTLPPNAPPGEYRVVTGLYRPGDQSRLPVAGGDSLPLFTISAVR